MEWMERLNEAIAYMEEHMQEEISFEEVAKIACTSSYNFQRMFSYMTGISLSEYIRRRRMSLAAEELQQGTDKIIDIALRYQYASPTAFNRAFRSVHGIAPSQVRNAQAAVKLYPPLHFQLSIAGSRELNYRIVKKDAFRVVGVCHELERSWRKIMRWFPISGGQRQKMERLQTFLHISTQRSQAVCWELVCVRIIRTGSSGLEWRAKNR